LNPGPPPRQGSINWDEFKQFLASRYSSATAKDRLRYALRFHNLLMEGDLSPLHQLSPHVRGHALRSLAVLSRFLGLYGYFKSLVKHYGLTWSEEKRDRLIVRRLEDEEDVISWVREACEKAPRIKGVVKLAFVTGLRRGEAIESHNLIIRGLYGEDETLEHYRFPHIFLRRTKKAYVSFVPRELLDEIKTCKPVTAYIVWNWLKRKGLPMRFQSLRRFWATYMLRYLSPTEVDFLQGRASSLLLTHYFTPSMEELKNRALKGERRLLEAVSS